MVKFLIVLTFIAAVGVLTWLWLIGFVLHELDNAEQDE